MAEREISTGRAGQIVARPQFGARALPSLARSLDTWPKPSIGQRMHHLFIILAVILPLAAHGCAPATDRMPPDSVLNPRGN
jgi:hypothetical protein